MTHKITRKRKVTAPMAPALLNHKQMQGLLNCSANHIDRMVKAGAIPPPVKIGCALRWVRSTVETWVAGGCPPLRK